MLAFRVRGTALKHALRRPAPERVWRGSLAGARVEWYASMPGGSIMVWSMPAYPRRCDTLSPPVGGSRRGGSQGQTPESHLKHEPCSRQWSQEQKCCGLQASQYSQSAHFSQASHPQGPVVGFVSFVIRQIYMPCGALSRSRAEKVWSDFNALWGGQPGGGMPACHSASARRYGASHDVGMPLTC